MLAKYIFLILVVLSTLLISCGKKKLFKQLSSSETGIHFNNSIIENDSLNPMDVTNIYNGGGVGIGDFNNDGLQDIYFTGNLVSNKLYLNKGKLQFEDITSQAGVDGQGKWCKGVSVVDINNDGWLDMYVCASMSSDPVKRQNLLYINQGADSHGIPHFKEMAAEYGLADTTHSTMAAFFDYDNDGDLDVYIVVNEVLKNNNPGVFRPILKDGSFPSTGRLYKNNWDSSLHHPVFTNVTKEAGVTIEGYGHSVSIADFNMDGWKDIFVTNDFVSNDLLYINNGDGTFSDKAAAYFKHTSANGMGQDVIDINNDGLSDVIELDMNPEDNYRKKMMMSPNSYQYFQNSDNYGYQYQYVRNTLQLNQGPRVLQNDSIGDPVFSEIGFYSGISETDWSWTPLVTDFNNDGFRDIIITNGFPRDVTDHDFISFRQKSYSVASKEFTLSQIPQVKLHNYAFQNKGNATFDDVTENWGLTIPSFSNGAVYADLDNDGDLDLVINNINDAAFVFKNMAREQNKENSHYLKVKCKGDSLNKNGIGAWIEIHYDNGKKQVWENTPYRGYLSTVQNIAHFGLNTIHTVDSVIVKWPNGKMQVLQNVHVDQLIQVNIGDASKGYSFAHETVAKNTLFKEVSDSVNIHFIHKEKDFVDFNIQKLLPHKLSEYGPALAVGDMDGNGLDDIISGGAKFNSAQLFLQQLDGKFLQKNLLPGMDMQVKNWDDMGLLLFDADGDGDLDLYIASGGYENPPNTNTYQDKLYVNDGKGNFTIDTSALPTNFTSKFCVRAVDYDKDGDLDLFVSGRVEPWSYPKPVSSFIFRNDSKNGHIKFTDVTKEVAKDLKNIGLVCDALFTDFDNDGWPDLILAGEWMPVTFLRNEKGIFKNVTAQTGLSNQLGLWNTIAAGDFDNDGDMDYIIGNQGQNSFYKASKQYPVFIYAKDFDNNGSYDAVPFLYLPASQENMEKKLFPAQTRDDIVKQMIGMRAKFQNYKSFAVAGLNEMFTQEQLKDALVLHANNVQSGYIRNEGNGKFVMMPLPAEAQFSMLNGMVADDFDNDGNLDIIINGNDYGTEVSVGRYDALNGLYLKGDGKGNFTPLSILQSGIYLPGNGKALAELKNGSGHTLLAASENRGPLKIYSAKPQQKSIAVTAGEVVALIRMKNGTTRRQELYHGSSFLSQSTRSITVGPLVASVEIIDWKMNTRKIIN